MKSHLLYERIAPALGRCALIELFICAHSSHLVSDLYDPALYAVFAQYYTLV